MKYSALTTALALGVATIATTPKSAEAHGGFSVRFGGGVYVGPRSAFYYGPANYYGTPVYYNGPFVQVSVAPLLPPPIIVTSQQAYSHQSPVVTTAVAQATNSIPASGQAVASSNNQLTLSLNDVYAIANNVGIQTKFNSLYGGYAVYNDSISNVRLALRFGENDKNSGEIVTGVLNLNNETGSKTFVDDVIKLSKLEKIAEDPPNITTNGPVKRSWTIVQPKSGSLPKTVGCTVDLGPLHSQYAQAMRPQGVTTNGVVVVPRP